ncbi:BnaC02g46450D [Brassica napus]|uniref:BnaC02g46450D protein n=1 Tax=Brassica napus TaxID=3708 RepID=A0A078J811_BRANA|nr:BnaC02g46450D [Brassica napus]
MNTLFYFLLASTAVLATTANASEPVVDADGDLISDGSYYAVPVSDNEEQGPCPKILKLGQLVLSQKPEKIRPRVSSRSRKLVIFFAVTSLCIVVTIRAATNLGWLWTDLAITVWLQPICHSSLTS